MSGVYAGLNEYAEACRFIAPLLAGIDGCNGVWEHPAPQNAQPPYITFQSAGNSDLVEMGDQRIWADILLQVVVWGVGNSTVALQPIADELDRRLQHASGETDAAQVIEAYRIQTLSIPEVDAGIAWRRLGGMYHFVIQKKGV